MRTLHGAVATTWWPDVSGAYTEDVARVDPAHGLAILAAGHGVIGRQGAPASKLALWSLIGELTARASDREAAGSIEARLARGVARAHEAVVRLSASWAPGLARPCATFAALIVDGERAVIAHLGACRVARITRAGGPAQLEPLTIDHTLAHLHADVPPALANIVAQALGSGAPIHAVDARPVVVGDRFLLVEPHLHRALGADAIAACADDDREVFAARLRARAIAAIGATGAASFVVVDVVDPGDDDDAPRAVIGDAQPPARSWLYAPGEPLPDPPPAWRAGLDRGPDDAWFREVFALALGGAP